MSRSATLRIAGNETDPRATKDVASVEPAASKGASHEPLAAVMLRRRCDPATLGFKTTDDLPDSDGTFGQARAVSAIRFAIDMLRPGYNVFVLGPSGVGKHAVVGDMLAEQAASSPTPSDWVYVENFTRPAEPRVLSLATGTGRRLAEDMRKLVEDLRAAIPAAFETREYATRLEDVRKEFQAKHDMLFAEIESTASARGIGVLRSPAGVVFAPVRGGSIMNPEEFEALPDEEKERFARGVQELQNEVAERVKELPRIHKELRQRVRDLDRSVTRYVVDNAVEELVRRYAGQPKIVEYLDSVRLDVMENAADFRRDKEEDGPAPFLLRAERRFGRYAVNVLVDNSETRGAPVVYDGHSTYDHLVGRIEHYAELGNLVTNFSLIKPGSLHRANGGFLLLDAVDLLTEPYAWGALKRALLGRRVTIEPLTHLMGLSGSESLLPEPIPLDVKVVLFGSRDIYYLLLEHDPQFAELFKVEADFEDAVERTPEAEREFSAMVATLARRRSIRTLAADAVARLVEESSRIAGDGRKLSTNIRRMFDLVQEAEHHAKGRESAVVRAEDIDRAVATQTAQRDRIRAHLLEAVARKTILIDVGGKKIGQVNGLAAVQLGDFMFGRPTRITATARIGEGRIIDIEREVELGGPLHSKGVLILTNYLAERYAKEYPLSLSASLVFEQSYNAVEGDSASLAELCALLSAIAAVPVKQSIALTGSINQSGEVQAIGAVNEKVEGFYDVCRALGIQGEHGVIVPRANLEHLMLREDVADAAQKGTFRIYPVDTVNDAMEILSDMPVGERDASGQSPEGTLNHLIEQQLIGYAVVARRFADLFEVHRMRKRSKGRTRKARRSRRSSKKKRP